MIQIERVILYHVTMKLKQPFTTSLGTISEREFIIVEVKDQTGLTGWGEVSAFSSPWYTEETIETCYHMLRAFFIPNVLTRSFTHPSDIPDSLYHFKGNRMAKAGIEAAVWDIYAKRENKSLRDVLGGTRDRIPSGVVAGLGPIDDMIQQIEQFVDQGYQRVKVKIKPGQDIGLLQKIRESFPHLPLMADANSAYELKDISKLKQLDDIRLLMIEQPLAADDIVDHRHLQKHLKTPICLDESICSLDDARKAVELGSCQIINVKPSRVGGLTEALKIHAFCKEQQIPLWCGGMIETGISRAQNVALATLPQFTIPGDISASSKYWEQDIIFPEIKVENGFIEVPRSPGMGVEVDYQALRSFSDKIDVFTKHDFVK
ncbi:o-succinylbenzoate synthase [Bacillus altitudinis]|uniref:o-succinylbenzoate synthase n=1 Tax=Bacillus altitudinis TaxID=293387 RepID=UPI000543CCEC|nr:o-succinylbenzoate synthase [Bacillus altitudinis]KWZ65605.1 o-succinylbenzoate synthase [Bacillus altitudinis]